MTDIKRILVVVDPTAKEQPAVGRAAWLAKKMNASLELFICEYDQHLSGERFFDSASLKKSRDSLLQHRRQQLEELAQPYLDEGLTVSVDARWDHPRHTGILRHAAEIDADMVVKDTHYHSVIRRSLFSNTDWNLIRDCSVPLLLVKPGDFREPTSIVAAVDPLHGRDKPAEMDHAILSAAEHLRASVGGEINVMHAFDPASVYVMSTDSMVYPLAMPIDDAVESLMKEHKEALDELMSGYSIPDSNIHLLEGDPKELLISQAESLNANIVVIGAIARGAIKRLVLGSTAEQVLDRIPCDVLIIKNSDTVASDIAANS